MNKNKITTAQKEINPTRLVLMMKEVYQKHLQSIVEKIDLTDKDGKILISKDLKVIHEPSGFEYTVDNVLQDEDFGIKVVLRTPETPRKNVVKNLKNQESSDSKDNTFTVDQKDFQKNYRES
jgi:hypothetical protein